MYIMYINLLLFNVILFIAIINLRGVSTKLSKYIVFTMQTYKKLNICIVHKNILARLYLYIPSADTDGLFFS